MMFNHETLELLCQIAKLLEEKKGEDALNLWRANRRSCSSFLKTVASELNSKFPDHESQENNIAHAMRLMLDNFDFVCDEFANNPLEGADYLSNKAKTHQFYKNLVVFSEMVL